MPTDIQVRHRYRKAKCCATCTHFDHSRCTVFMMNTLPTNLCDEHDNNYAKDPRGVKCCQCRYGGNGDRTCKIGGAHKKGFNCCFLGVPIKGKERKNGKD